MSLCLDEVQILEARGKIGVVEIRGGDARRHKPCDEHTPQHGRRHGDIPAPLAVLRSRPLRLAGESALERGVGIDAAQREAGDHDRREQPQRHPLMPRHAVGEQGGDTAGGIGFIERKRHAEDVEGVRVILWG